MSAAAAVDDNLSKKIMMETWNPDVDEWTSLVHRVFSPEYERELWDLRNEIIFDNCLELGALSE